MEPTFTLAAILIGLGLFASAVYYFARFYFKTDYDQDISAKTPEKE